jgi:Domain of unknown function (DUF4265)
MAESDAPDAPQSVKLCFELEPEEEDWPPVRTENVWARPVGGDEYELENIPWFVRGVAIGDRVRASRDDDGVLTFRDKIAWSGRYTIRVIPTAEGSSREQIEEVVAAFQPLGAECEGGLPAFKIVALDIPPAARLSEIKTLLEQGEAEGRWEWEEGCVDDQWANL